MKAENNSHRSWEHVKVLIIGHRRGVFPENSILITAVNGMMQRGKRRLTAKWSKWGSDPGASHHLVTKLLFNETSNYDRERILGGGKE